VKKLKSSSKAPKKQKENKEAAKKKEISGVIYVGHLPYGFVEEGLKNYFEQYGEVLRVKLMRSKRTARSRGFGFVEFLDKEVAEIAVKSMNGYMMFGTRLECRLLDKSEEHGNLFIRSNKKFKFIPWHVIYQKNMNRVSLGGTKETKSSL
jgi:nucleolar protein 15